MDSHEPPEVRALVAAARDGRRDAFGELVALYERPVYRAALAALGSPEDAEDVAQEAFVAAWRKLSGFRAEATFKTWLLTITWRKAIDRRTRNRTAWRRLAPVDPVNPRAALESLPGATPDPERSAVASDRVARVRDAIERLTPKLRDTLLLAASGEHSYPEIARMLGVPVGTVKWRVAEARRLVRERMPDEKA